MVLVSSFGGVECAPQKKSPSGAIWAPASGLNYPRSFVGMPDRESSATEPKITRLKPSEITILGVVVQP